MRTLGSGCAVRPASESDVLSVAIPSSTALSAKLRETTEKLRHIGPIG